MDLQMQDESFPVDVDGRPPSVTKQWTRSNPDGSKTTRFVGADGYLYERVRKQGEPDQWSKVGLSE
jgi:hypothetical protein